MVSVFLPKLFAVSEGGVCITGVLECWATLPDTLNPTP